MKYADVIYLLKNGKLIEKFNDKFEKLGLKIKSKKGTEQYQQEYLELQDTTQQMVQTEDFGEVARWLVNNSEKFGFIWTGFS